MGFFRIKVKRHDHSWVREKHGFITKQNLEEAGRALLAAVRQEIDRERAMDTGKSFGSIPTSPRFKASFRCQVVGQEIQILSNWPNLDALLTGRKPFQMTWLTQQAGVPVVPMVGAQDQVLFRTTPRFKAQAWWHPGVRKHDFLDRAVEKAWPKIEKILLDAVMKRMASLPPV